MSGVTRSGADYYNVYLGFWTNWSAGKVEGATLTTTRQSGGLLIAFLAIFVGAAGKSLWRVSCLILHRYFSTSKSQDALYHHRQTLLRNAETPQTALWQLLQLINAWRRRAKSPFARLSPLFILASVIATAFSVAGLFSSRVTTETASQVLLTGRDCRTINPVSNNFSDMLSAEVWVNKRTSSYLNYAQQCYTQAENSEDCQLYVRPSIPLKTTHNASCPFDEKMCKTKSIIVDTGLLNSNGDLGLNLPPSAQFQLRFVHQCAPIVSEGYVSLHNQSTYPDIPLARYHYGNSTTGSGADFVYQVAANLNDKLYEGFDSENGVRAQYQLGVLRSEGGNLVPPDTDLIPELRRPDADLSLFFLSSPGVQYIEPINDPFYSAHKPGGSGRGWGVNTSEAVQFYWQDEPASVLGCITQSQFCDPRNSTLCQPLRGFRDNLHRLDEIWDLKDGNNKELDWATTALVNSHIPFDRVVYIAGSAALTARFGQSLPFTATLADDQWVQDVFWWASTSATSTQAAFVESAMGLQGFPEKLTAMPDTDQARRVCTSQKIISARYSSFSVLGVSLILAVGGIMIILEMVLEDVLDWLQKKKTRHDYSRLEWKANATLQLHRIAHEEISSGTWSRTIEAVPVTAEGQLLAPLDISNRDHPRLQSTLKSVSAPTTANSDPKLQSTPQLGETGQQQAIPLNTLLHQQRSLSSLTSTLSQGG